MHNFWAKNVVTCKKFFQQKIHPYISITSPIPNKNISKYQEIPPFGTHILKSVGNSIQH